MIPHACPALDQPCGHPELTQSGPAILDYFRGLAIVAGVCLVVWALWKQVRLTLIRRREESQPVHRGRTTDRPRPRGDWRRPPKR